MKCYSSKQIAFMKWLCPSLLVLVVNCSGKSSGSKTAAEASQEGPTKLTDFTIKQVHITDKFWSPRIETNHKATLETVLRKNTESGAIQNLAIAAGKAKGEFRGPFWSDSDVYKWLEGASYTLALTPDAAL